MCTSFDDFAADLAAGLGDALIHIDVDGIIRHWNRGASRIFGFAESEALGASLDLIVPESLRARHWDGFRQMMATGRSKYPEGHVLSVPALRKDGARISVEFTVVAFADSGGRMTGIAAIMRDATARFEELRTLRKELAMLRPGGQAD